MIVSASEKSVVVRCCNATVTYSRESRQIVASADGGAIHHLTAALQALAAELQGDDTFTGGPGGPW